MWAGFRCGVIQALAVSSGLRFLFSALPLLVFLLVAATAPARLAQGSCKDSGHSRLLHPHIPLYRRGECLSRWFPGKKAESPFQKAPSKCLLMSQRPELAHDYPLNNLWARGAGWRSWGWGPTHISHHAKDMRQSVPQRKTCMSFQEKGTKWC